MRKTLFIYVPSANSEAAGWLLRDEQNQVESQQPGWPEAKYAKNNRVVLVLGAENSLCLPAQFPGRKNLNAWRKAAPWILEDHLADDSSELHYAIAPEPEADGRYLVAAGDPAPIEALLDQLQEQYIHVDAIILDACLLPDSDGQPLVYASLGNRTLIKDSSGASALPAAAAKNLLGEAEAWLDAENPLAALDALSAQWNPQTSLNLRQGELAPGEAMVARLRPWRSAAIAAGITAVLWTGISAIELNNLKAENTALRQEMQAVFKQALPGSRMVKPKTQLEQALNNSGASNQGGFLLALQAATAPLENISDAKLVSLDQRGNNLVLNLSASQISTVEQIKTAMSQLTGYSAEVGSVRADPDNVQLRVTIRPQAS